MEPADWMVGRKASLERGGLIASRRVSQAAGWWERKGQFSAEGPVNAQIVKDYKENIPVVQLAGYRLGGIRKLVCSEEGIILSSC